MTLLDMLPCLALEAPSLQRLSSSTGTDIFMLDPLPEPVVFPSTCPSPLPTSGLAPSASPGSESCQKVPLSPAHHRLLPDMMAEEGV